MHADVGKSVRGKSIKQMENENRFNEKKRKWASEMI